MAALRHPHIVHVYEISEPKPTDKNFPRDWFNDPVFLRWVVFRTFELLPDDLDGVFEAEDEDIDELMGHVYFLNAVDSEISGEVEDEDDEEGEGEEDEEEQEARPKRVNPLSASD